MFTRKKLYIKLIGLLILVICMGSVSMMAENGDKKDLSSEQIEQQEKPKNKGKKKKKNKKQKKEVNSPVREEIQRYLGYEILPVRYLSLPYDMSVNSNVPGKHVEIGYLFLMFIPIILLLGFKGRPGIGISIMAASILLLLISTCTSNIFNTERNPIQITEENLNDFLESTNFSDVPASVFCAYAYKAFLPVYQPIENLLAKISGDSDYITYPLLLILFAALFFLMQKRIQQQSKINRTLVNLLYACFRS